MIDNYDCFTYNLVQYLGELGEDVHVHRNDAIDARRDRRVEAEPDRRSRRARARRTRPGISVPLIERFAGKIPILGVCLGHQAIGQAFGGKIVRAKHVMHGKISPIDARRPRRVPRPALAALRRRATTRWRSSAVAARVPRGHRDADDGEIMGVRHRSWPVEGVQFHPEAILTEHGHALLAQLPRGHVGARCSPANRRQDRHGHHAAGSAAAHDRAPRDLPRRDAVAHAPDHERRSVAGDDRGAHHRPAREEGDDRRDRRRRAGDARVRDEGRRARHASTSSTSSAPAATRRTRSTSRPRRCSSPRRPARASRSTATAPCRRSRAAPTCSRRSARTSC